MKVNFDAQINNNLFESYGYKTHARVTITGLKLLKGGSQTNVMVYVKELKLWLDLGHILNTEQLPILKGEK